MNSRVIPYGRQWIDDDDVAAVVETLRGDWLTQGPRVRQFEDALTEITGARYAVAVANGTAALHLACLAAGVGPGDLGLTATVTFVASANGVRYCGAEPRLVDVEPETGLMDVSSLEERVVEAEKAGRPPKVILPVDLTGAVADLPRVSAIATRVGARVIEDAAHALGATYEFGGRTYRAASCAHSDMAILSFHPVKHITTGEGGAITTNDQALYQKLCELRTHGITKDPSRLERNEGPWWYEQQTLGFNYRITDMQCALGVRQARRLPQFLERRRVIAAHYDAAFRAPRFAEKLRPLTVPDRTFSAYHLYVVSLQGRGLEEIAARRRALFQHLVSEAIYPQVHYIPIHRQPDFVRNGLANGSFPGAELYYAGCISLPMYPAMTDDDVHRVVEAVARGVG